MPTEAAIAPLSGARARVGAVQIVQRMGQGGIETLALDLIQAGVANRGLLSLQSSAPELIAAWPALTRVAPILRGFNQGSGLDVGMLASMTQYLRELRPHAVLLHHIGPLLYGGLSARLAGVPRIVHVEHDAWHYEREPKNIRIAQVAQRLVRPRRVAVSNDIARAVMKFLPTASFTVIPPAIDTARFLPQQRANARQALGFRPEWRIAGTAGRLVEVKGHAVLIAALASLPADVHAVIAGEGPLKEELSRQAAALGLEARVHLIGRTDQLEAVLPAFDIFVLPSLNEGLPRVILEAQSCGLSVVASSVGSIADAVNPATARLFPSGESAACALAMREAFEQGGTSAQANRTFVEQNFNWMTAVSDYRRLIEA